MIFESSRDKRLGKLLLGKENVNIFAANPQENDMRFFNVIVLFKRRVEFRFTSTSLPPLMSFLQCKLRRGGNGRIFKQQIRFRSIKRLKWNIRWKITENYIAWKRRFSRLEFFGLMQISAGSRRREPNCVDKINLYSLISHDSSLRRKIFIVILRDVEKGRERLYDLLDSIIHKLSLISTKERR